ncbi:MAG: magnesium transporter CorA family protein [Deltaproteobacteria bacterium]|jgi:magnesium transporter|nr:magnesium transporter CorA family protein [Deltaproteobacteria bacterium]
MLSYFKFTEEGFIASERGDATFINVENPDPGEINQISNDFSIPLLFLADPLDPRERPRIEKENQATLFIIRVSNECFPVIASEYCPQSQLATFNTIPLGIILVDNKVITICRNIGLVLELLGRITRKPRPHSRLNLIFKILMESSTDFIHHLERLEELTDRAELTLSQAQQNEEIMTLLAIDKTLIHFTVAIKSNRGIMEKLMDNSYFSLTPDELSILERALTENQQAIFMADTFSQILGSMGDAFGTIISNNLNKVVKFLTGITIIIMLPSVIVGAYGMNVALPLEKQPLAFWIIVIVCLLSCSLLWIFFSRKKWV